MTKTNLEQLVWDTLKEVKETRSDDKGLFLEVWKKQGFKLTDTQESLFYKIAFPETVTRIRRKIQARGIFKATPYVQAQRKLFTMQKREKVRKEKDE